MVLELTSGVESSAEEEKGRHEQRKENENG